MGLIQDDIFLVNRLVGGEWKSFKIRYEDLKEEIGGEDALDVDTFGYQLQESDVEAAADPNVDASHKLNFTCNGTANPIDFGDVTQFVFHPSWTTVANVNDGDEIRFTNITTKKQAIYKATADGSNDGAFGRVSVVHVSGDGDINEDDIGNFRLSTVNSGGGGDISIGTCPPGYVSDGSGGCTPDTGPNPIVPNEGDLWYNANNGITYVYYVNVDGLSGNEGQWVDVRPGGGGSGGGDFVSIYAWTSIPALPSS